jgi:signal transduction histidine kinase
VLNHKEHLAQLGEAVAKVSHDLRNILTTVQLISDRLTQSEDPVVMRLAPKLEANVARAVTLAETTLSFGRASEPAPILGQVDLTLLLQDVVETELMAIGQLPIDVRFEVSENLIIRADPEQLHRALSNLVRNARQTLADQSKGGAIVLKAWQTPQFWIIEVVDNGPGLPEKAEAHLFKPFQGTATGGGIRIGLGNRSGTDAWAWRQRRVLRGEWAWGLFPAYIAKVDPR